MVSASKFINTITNSIQNQEIREQIPVLTGTNTLGQVWSVLEANTDLYSAFASALVNRIARVRIEDNTDWRDPIREFIGGGTEEPLGYFEQHIGENPLTPHEFDPNDFTAILRRYGSDTKAVYFKRNYKRYFAITIDYDGLKQAFVSDDEFLRYVKVKRNTLKVSYELNSFNTFKEIICSNYAGNAFITKALPSIATKEQIEDFTAELNTYIDNFAIYSKDYNNYSNIEGATGGYYTATKKEDVRIIARADLINSYMVKSLASAFNMSMAEIDSKILKIPAFEFDIINTETGQNLGTESTNIALLLCDKRLFHFVKNLDKYAEQFNAGNLTTNLFHHYWNTYGINPMANAIVYYIPTADEEKLSVFASQPLIKQDYPAEITVKGTNANPATNIVDFDTISIDGVESSVIEEKTEEILSALGITTPEKSSATVSDWFDDVTTRSDGSYVIKIKRSATDLNTITGLENLSGGTSGKVSFAINAGTVSMPFTLYFTVSADY